MSEEAPVSRKERKAQRDAERQNKGSKKRKREENVAEEETQNAELQQDFIPLAGDPDEEAAVEAKLKAQSKGDATKTKDIKRSKSKSQHHRGGGGDGEGEDVKQPKSKKRRTAKPATEQQAEGEQDGEATTASTTKPRFILFIGNLPYSTTDASLQNYFKSIAPFTLRHRTDPKTHKSKGFAFLEFENFDRMKTCMKLYHHSMFNPALHSGTSAEDGLEVKKDTGKDRGARRINVELTAGGGGSKEGRMEKIKAKNVRLDEQRRRRAEVERKEKEKERLKAEEKESKVKEEGGRNKKGWNGKSTAGAESKIEKRDVKQDDAAQVHPSRLARVMG